MSVINTYVKALASAVDANEAQKILEDLEKFKTIFSKELKKYLSSPIIGLEDKFNLLEEIAQKLSFHKKFLNFLKLLVKYGKISFFEKMYRELRDILLLKQGKIEVDITVAREIKEEVLNEIKEKVKKLTGKELIPYIKIDPEIIGGVYIKIRNTICDATIKGYLNDLQKRILEG